jgi:hypothetical protein
MDVIATSYDGHRTCTGRSEDGVSEHKPDLSRLADLASGIGLHEHCCLIYETEEEQFAAALPFLRSGLDRGEKCLFVADETVQ